MVDFQSYELAPTCTKLGGLLGVWGLGFGVWRGGLRAGGFKVPGEHLLGGGLFRAPKRQNGAQ